MTIGACPRPVRRIAAGLALLLALAALCWPVVPAQADTFSQIAHGLRADKLYVTSEAAGALPAADQAEVRRALDAAADTDIRVVVTRSGVTRPELGAMLEGVKDRVGKGDTYVGITADNKMAAISERLSGTELNRLIAQSAGGDIADRLVSFTRLAEDKAQESQRASTMMTLVLIGVLVLIVATTASLMLVARRRRRERAAREMADLKKGVQEDVTLLGEDIASLDLDLTDPALDPAIRGDYERALNSYDAAKAAVEAAQRPEDMREVTAALEDGRYAMTAVRARLAGEPPPERRAPCFFNPQHGPSVQDVEWAPPGGTPRPVPACAADAEAVLNGGRPDPRMVPVGGTRRPYWEAGPAYAPYAGGYYRGYGGVDLLSGMLIGTALGSMFGGGWGGFGGYDAGFGGADQFGGDTGDIGGGWDFGSGDFGGGGFGGGDF